MLVLNRKIGEQIQIGGEIVVIVKQIKGNRVSIGIQAPQSMDIRRSELSIHPSQSRC